MTFVCTNSTLPGREEEFSFEHTFIDALEPAIQDLARREIKSAVNAGSSENCTAKLAI